LILGHAQPISYGAGNLIDLPLEAPIGSLAVYFRVGALSQATLNASAIQVVHSTPSQPLVIIAPQPQKKTNEGKSLDVWQAAIEELTAEQPGA
jgi:hypothetical protein